MNKQLSLTVGLLMIITLVAFEALAVATVLPLAQEELGGLRLYGWAFSAFLLASLVGIAWAGEEADRYGPARPFVIGLVMFAIGLVVGGIATSMWILVLGRAIQGLGAGVMPTVIYVCIGRAYDESVRPRLLALSSTAWVVPGLIGPGIAAAVGEAISWRVVFLGLLPLLVLAAVLTLRPLMTIGPGDASESGERKAPVAVVLAVGVALLLGGATAPKWYFAAPLFAAGLPVSLYAARVLLPAGVFRLKRGVPATVIGNGILNLAFFGAEAFVPFALKTVRDESTFLVGAGLTVSAIFWSAGTWTLERMKGRIDRRVTMVIGLSLVGCQAVAMAAAMIPAAPVAVALVAWPIGALGMGLAYPSFSLTVLSLAEAGREGIATSALKLCESLGAALGAGISGALIAAGGALDSERGGTAAAFLAMAVLAFSGILVALRAHRPAT